LSRAKSFSLAYSENLDERVMQIFNEDAYLKELLKNSEIVRNAMQITGYSCNVKSLHGKGFALLGNAGEFLDPVFLFWRHHRHEVCQLGSCTIR
jgi:hypothetical protein